MSEKRSRPGQHGTGANVSPSEMAEAKAISRHNIAKSQALLSRLREQALARKAPNAPADKEGGRRSSSGQARQADQRPEDG